MIKRVTLTLLSIIGAKAAESGYIQKLRDLTFDMNLQHEYPTAWETYGTAVPIMSKTKIIPKIPMSNG